MADIKPIETVYKGYRFRSRLEARWAVFFDALGIEYEYEPEGFDLGDGIYYLPDFYLPHDDVWVEIKGKQLDDSEREKIMRFCKAKCDLAHDGSRFRLLEGQIPDIFEAQMVDKNGNPFIMTGIPSFVYVSPDSMLKVDEEQLKLGMNKLKEGVLLLALWRPAYTDEDVASALIQAKQARFEHGEYPMIKKYERKN